MQVAYLSLALHMPVGRRSCRQNGQVPGSKVSLPPSEPFVNGRRSTEIDDKDMTRKSRQGKIIERVDDLGHIKPMPALSAARLHNVFKRNIEYGSCVFSSKGTCSTPCLPSCGQKDAADTGAIPSSSRFYHRTSSSRKNT